MGAEPTGGVSPTSRRLVFLGTPVFAVPTLHAVVEAGHDIRLVVSKADTRRGRGGRTSPSPVKAAALDLGLPVSDRVDDVLSTDAELGVVVAFGRIIKPHVLAAVPMVNLHFSLLPRWRGAAPLERAILAGDERTGVDLMVVEEGLDTGAVYDRFETPIGPDDTAGDLRDLLAREGARLVVENLGKGLTTPTPQEGAPTYAHKIDPAELEIDWAQPAVNVHRLVRIGGAWTTFRGKRLKVWRSSLDHRADGVPVPAGDADVTLLEVQPEGKGWMPAKAWANGVHWRPGERLGT